MKKKKRQTNRKKESKKILTINEIPQSSADDCIKNKLLPEGKESSIRVQLNKSKTDLFSNWASIILCAATIILVIYAAIQIGIQKETLEEIKTDVKLTHKPVVFVKKSIPPQNENEIKDGKNHWFVITNSGRTPALNVKIRIGLDDVYDSNNMRIQGIEIGEFSIMELASIYPDQEISFKLSDVYIPLPIKTAGSWPKALIRIILSYQGEDLKRESKATQHLIFSDKTDYKWRFVGADFLRRVETEREKKAK